MTKTAIQHIDEESQRLIGLAYQIWAHPEIANQEYFAVDLLSNYLAEEGFTVETQYAGVPTAFRASWGNGRPVIGFLGEYDALPGMSQIVADYKAPVKEGSPGHACQHNLLGVSHIGAAMGLKRELAEKGLPGTVVFYGCPAEETLTGKGFMARGGAFRELDAAIAWHPSTQNIVSLGTMSGINSATFHFKGVTSHAGADPQNGRSALDAVELMNVGANYLREHVTDDVRIHYTITNGGQAPNIVPDRASVWYFVRALSREGVMDTYERLIKVAKGAAMMTETQVEIQPLGGCYNTLQNSVLSHLIHETMTELPLPQWSDEELQFAEKLNSEVNNTNMYNLTDKSSPIHNQVLPVSHSNMYGSTDVGDVMHIVPGVFFMTAAANIGAASHSWHNTACSAHAIGHKAMLHGAQVMAAAALKMMLDPSIVERAHAEFQEVMRGREYICPISDEVSIPV